MICKPQCTRYDLEFIEFDVITIIVLMRDIETRSSDIKTEYLNLADWNSPYLCVALKDRIFSTCHEKTSPVLIQQKNSKR